MPTKFDERSRHYETKERVTITAALVLLIYAVIQAPELGWAAHKRSCSLPDLRPRAVSSVFMPWQLWLFSPSVSK